MEAGIEAVVSWVRAHPVLAQMIAGAWAGFIAAARADYRAYRAWRDDPTTAPFQFDWRVALPRWTEGAVLGALAGLGFGGAGEVVS